MEVTECTKIIHERINKFDPDNAIKIIGYLLLTCAPEELRQYALASDRHIYSVASEVKAILGSSPKPIVASHLPSELSPRYMPLPPTVSRPFSSPSSFRVPAWQPPLTTDVPHPYNDFLGMAQNQADIASLEEQLPPFNPLHPDFLSNYYLDAQPGDGLGSRFGLRSPSSMSDFLSKPCHYFYSGFCRHGTSCRYSHGQAAPDIISQMYSLNLNDLVNDDSYFPPGSLEKLEVEISELLKARNGMPVSIASLPMIYHEIYGKALQAEGYLTESQRHGKAGFSLTKLLAQLKNIRLIDRPHGQHSVVLAEDAPKYMEYPIDRSDVGALLPSSHQIYLTFPAESTFTDEDVMRYFMQFGPVRDVRIPRQEKRMFGFVSFHFPETVKTILGKSHPHNICGSRVLVKPYKEKTRVYDRKYPEKMELPMCYPHCFEIEPDINTVPEMYGNSRLLNKQLLADRVHAYEMERRRLMEMQLASKPLVPQNYSSFGFEDLTISEDRCNPTVAKISGNSSNDKPRATGNNFSDQGSGIIELPDSPFASPRLGKSNI
ncbi:zinc finger CCCH domain-containing protein 18-like [Iris pallida]|uniref:Zinc finger CCCH domain-containing protein 18-like n=1 Tax=Iris pallida TaxID=29817 RepID=A0AAX6HQQ5_IRIPA|nr:zinc finger CCCH domain-containing protein 18-like [Iris pallida]